MKRALTTAALLAAASTAGLAQSATARTTNMSGDWIGSVGTVYFNFIHRFESSPAPERKVTNSPTFLLATPVTPFALVGTSYATNSTLAPRFPNEHEYFLRVSPLRQADGAPLDAGAQVDYNDAASGADAELALGRRIGRLKVMGTGRVLSRLDATGYETAYGGGAVLRLGRYVAVAADAASLAHRVEEHVAWGAGLQFELPQTPHTMSLQVTNVGTSTLQGMSRGEGRARYGFEYTIPVTLRRYTSHQSPPPRSDSMRVTPSSTAAGPVVQLHIKSLAFQSQPTIAVGTTVEWINDDPLAHSVAAADSSFRSPLIQPGKSWKYTFTTAGKFPFACEPHPFMHGTVIVK
jgi:plastocyanin